MFGRSSGETLLHDNCWLTLNIHSMQTFLIYDGSM